MLKLICVDVAGMIADCVDGISLECLGGTCTLFAELVKERRKTDSFLDYKLISSVPLMVWAFKFGLNVRKTIWDLALQGKMEMVGGLMDHGFKGGEVIVCIAAGNGDLELVKKILLNGGLMCNAAPGWAAKKGHLEVIQWMEENGFVKWKYESDLLSARRGGHEATYQWLIDHGWPSA
jgi:hypothetical protein